VTDTAVELETVEPAESAQPLSPSSESGRRRGRPGRPATGGMRVDQGEGLGDVDDVRRGGDDLERGAASVADQVVLAARLPAVDR
jgi:hypothetical protein